MPILTFIENKNRIKIEFEGTPILRDLLIRHKLYIDSPCGASGKCGKCKVSLRGEVSPPNAAEQKNNCRLACQARLFGDCEAELLQNEAEFAEILTESDISVQKSDEWLYGVAIDIGTTTVVLKLYNNLGICVAEAADINPQREIAFDIIGRLSEAENGKAALLQQQITQKISELLLYACRVGRVMPEQIGKTVITGNTAMLYLYSGISPKSIARAPFAADNLFGVYINGNVYLAPCISAFIGGDLVCALLASKITEHGGCSMLIDIGTNGELALWKGNKLFVTSCAAGPAFEGGEISVGCGSILGAVERVTIDCGKPKAETIGCIAPVGICGSGLIDAASVFLDLGYIDKSGYASKELVLSANGGSIKLLQDDIRALQLAKSAIRAGIEALLTHTETQYGEIETLYIAGGFGNRLSVESAINIGLLPKELAGRVKYIGNAALGGAVSMLFNSEEIEKAEHIAKNASPLNLATSPEFYESFIKYIDF